MFTEINRQIRVIRTNDHSTILIEGNSGRKVMVRTK